MVGVINFILIATGSINYIASVSLISLAICYMIGCLSYMGLKKKYPDMKRPYKAPLGAVSYTHLDVYKRQMLMLTDEHYIEHKVRNTYPYGKCRKTLNRKYKNK